MALFVVKIYQKEYEEMLVCADSLQEVKRYMKKTEHWKDVYPDHFVESITQVNSPKELDEEDLEFDDYEGCWCFANKDYGWIDNPQPYEAFYGLKSTHAPYETEEECDSFYETYHKLKEEAKQKFLEEYYK